MILKIYKAMQSSKKYMLLPIGIVLCSSIHLNAQVLPDSLQVKQVAAVGYLEGGKALTTMPTSFFNHALTGRLAGLHTSENNGEPGLDNLFLSLRGVSPVIIVDGIPRTINEINPEQIESITLLKDALSAAKYGLVAAEGALLITTKNGKNSKGRSLNITAKTGLNSHLKQREILSAYDYAVLYNEALANDGRPAMYSPSAIQAYKDGSNPYLYPNVDWKKQILDNHAPFSRVNLNAEGADKDLNYFVSLDYLTEEGALKTLKSNPYNTNVDYERFNFRTNVEMKLAKRLKGTVSLYANSSNKNNPGQGRPSSLGFGTLYSSILNTPQGAYPVLNPDSTLGGNILFSNNIYGQSVYSGYTKFENLDGSGDFGLRREMDDVLKGLWIEAKASYYMSKIQVIERSKDFQTFEFSKDQGGNDVYTRFGTQTTQSNFSLVFYRNQQFFAEGSAGYSTSLRGNALDFKFNYNYQNTRVNSQLPQKFNTGSLNITYNVHNKYIFDVIGVYSGNNWYEKGKQFSFYPAGGFSWNINRENFFKKDGFINTLKLRTSYGKMGLSDPGYYTYRYSYTNTGTTYYFGTGAGGVQGSEEAALPSFRDHSEVVKLDVGINTSFSKNRGYLMADYYLHTSSGLLQQRGQASSLLGIAYPLENLGKRRSSGVELSGGWADKAGELGYRLNANISFSNSKLMDIDEPKMPYSWMQKTGQSGSQIYGFVADGFVQTAGTGPTVEGYTSVPGDIKYKDLNGDGFINQYDVTGLLDNKPFVFYGFDMGFDYKNFEFSFLFQGVSNRNVMLTGLGEWAFQNNGTGNAFEQHLDRWTPQTATTASYPRLSVGPNINNNVASSFWLKKIDFLRLKNVEFAYNLETSFLKKIKVNKMRFFVNGANLLTFSDMKRVDPESLSFYYPLQRVVSGGVTIKF